MKNKWLALITTILVLVMNSVPVFAENENVNNNEAEMLDAVIEDMQMAQEDGTISRNEQREIFKDVPQEVIEDYNEILFDEVDEIIKENCTNVPIDSNDEFVEKECFDLDCGGQLIIESKLEDIDGASESDTATRLLERLNLISYADSQEYGTKKHTQKYTMIGVGTLKLTLVTTVKASSTGLKITGTSATSNSNGLMYDTNRKSKIEKTSAGKGETCKSLGGVQYYMDLVPYGHTSKKWKKLRCSFKVTSINTSSKKVNFTYTTKTFDSSSW